MSPIDTADSEVFKIGWSNKTRSALWLFPVFFAVFFLISLAAPAPINIIMWCVIIAGGLIYAGAMHNWRKYSSAIVGADGSLQIYGPNGPVENTPDNCVRLAYRQTYVRCLPTNIVSVSLPNPEERALAHLWSVERLRSINPITKLQAQIRFTKNFRTREVAKGCGLFSFFFVSDEEKLVKLTCKQMLIRNDFEEYTMEELHIFLSLQEPDQFVQRMQRAISKPF